MKLWKYPSHITPMRRIAAEQITKSLCLHVSRANQHFPLAIQEIEQPWKHQNQAESVDEPQSGFRYLGYPQTSHASLFPDRFATPGTVPNLFLPRAKTLNAACHFRDGAEFDRQFCPADSQ